MAFDLAESKWTDLAQLLLECHAGSSPNGRAKTSIRGWIEAAGPSFETGDPAQAISRIESRARDHEFREIDAEWILRDVRSARKTWVMHFTRVNTSMTLDPPIQTG